MNELEEVTEVLPKVYLASVYLAPGEWSGMQGGQMMWKAAEEVFDKHPDKDPLVVKVYEHGGWWLHYTRDGTIVGTANDGAVLCNKAKEFHKLYQECQFERLPETRRN